MTYRAYQHIVCYHEWNARLFRLIEKFDFQRQSFSSQCPRLHISFQEEVQQDMIHLVQLFQLLKQLFFYFS